MDPIKRILESRLVACVACTNRSQSAALFELQPGGGVLYVPVGPGALVFHSPTPRTARAVQDFKWSFARVAQRTRARGLPYTILANTGGASCAEESVSQARASDLLFRDLVRLPNQSRPVIKLEVLDERLRPVDDEVIAACRELIGSDHLAVIPLVIRISPSSESASPQVCRPVRVIGGTHRVLAGPQDSAALSAL
jgi:hypothetical protein